MAPPDASVAAPVAVPTPDHTLNKGFHAGPKGTVLRGFGVAELNQFHYDVAATVDLPPEDPEAIANTKHTTQGVDAEPYTIVQGPQDWKAADYKDSPEKWQTWLTEQDIAEIEAALEGVKAKGLKVEELTKDAFPLPTLGPKLQSIGDEVVLGKGFHLIKGFPVKKFSRFETAATYYAFGLYWGNPQAQNAKGHTLGHIRAIGTNASQEGVRPYTTNIAHGVHSDNSDIVGLLCLQDAAEGGVTTWTSSVAIHNALLRRGRKDLVQVLTEGEFFLPAYNVWGSPADKWDAEGPGDGWVNQPPFLYHKGRLLANFKEGAYYYVYNPKFTHAPKYTPLQEEALRTFTALALSPELRLDLRLEPGDIGLVNNLSVLHAKSAFKDYTDPAKKRHLLRLWVAALKAPELPEDSSYIHTWGSVEVGNRGGYWLGHSYEKHTPLFVEFGDLEANRPENLELETAAA